jgi:hypothetical protein
MLHWTEFAAEQPDLAEWANARLAEPPAFLATIRADSTPRVHPVTPVVSPDGLFVFMEPTSPKGNDLRDRRSYALHNGVRDTDGTGGELIIFGTAVAVDDADLRDGAVAAATYEPADRYVLFELLVTEVRCNGYGDTTMPATRRWRSP